MNAATNNNATARISPLRIWLRRLAWLAGIALVLLLLAWQGIPALIKWQGPPRLSELLGRPVTIGNVAFKPWALDLTVDDFVIGAAPQTSAEPLLQVKRLHANASIASLFKLAPILEAIDIDAPSLRLARSAEGRYDIDDLIERFTPRPRPDEKSAKPARFALYNVQLRDGAVRFDDQPAGRVQTIGALHLSLPFLSNLPASVKVIVRPHLAFQLNGTAFDSGAQATPFAQPGAGTLNLKMAGLDLAPYLGYLPKSLPVRIQRGSVSADLQVSFEMPEGKTPSVSIKGNAGAKQLVVDDADGQSLLAIEQAQIALRDVQPLAQRVAVDKLRIEGARLHVTRDAAGQLNLLGLAPQTAPKTVPASAKKASQDEPWRASVETIELANTEVRWNDATVQPAAALQLDHLDISANKVQWPLAAPIAVRVNGELRAQATGAPLLATISAEGPVTDEDAKLDIALSKLNLSALAPYLAQSLALQVEGVLSAKARLDWSANAAAPRLQLALAEATLDALQLREGGGRTRQDVAALKQLALAGVQVDVLGRSVVLGSVKLVQPALTLTRDRKGELNAARWTVADTAPSSPPRGKAAPPWHVQLGDLALDGGRIKFTDGMPARSATEPVRVDLTLSKLALRNLEWQGDRSTKPAQVELAAQIAGTLRKARTAGKLYFTGSLGATPLQARGKLRLERFPLHIFAPYLTEDLQLALLHADAGYVGNVVMRKLPAGFDVQASGDAQLSDVRVATLPNAPGNADPVDGDELLTWQTLALTSVDVVLKPHAKPQITIGSTALDDFYSRLVLSADGRFNLQGVVAAAPDGAASSPAAAVPPQAAAAAASSPASAPVAHAADELPVDLSLGTTKLSNGRIDFTDHFIRPNYSAALTELNGQIGPFTSTSRDMATIELRGKAEGTAQVEIGGALNPMVDPLALDIKAKVTDLELAPLSPYAGKYAGYAIERGKLSMSVAYKIDADGKLVAQNQVVLNQLTFGDKVESKDATSLPVLLAVALLKDRNGVIDINLPISGSLNDPQFSIGGLVVKVIVNLLTKAITAPFALLTGGGSDELSRIDFIAGRATMSAAGATALDKVAKALSDRPALKMTVTGDADANAERDAYQRAVLDARLRALRKREAEPDGAASAPAGTSAPIPAEERKRLLEQLYDASKIPDKPKNFLGLAKSIPAPQMEALLLKQIPVGGSAMRELALQRSVAVRDALIAKGLSNERLFLAAPKLDAAGDAGATWTPRAELSLGTR